jgi:3-deoxy-D-manno-octulosonic-acid transferase
MPDEKLLIAGSTHPKEEDIIVSAYAGLKEQYDELRLLIAPRHNERSAEVQALITKKGKKAKMVSKLSTDPGFDEPKSSRDVFILDTVGQLKDFYSIAEIVFVGGSLVKKGGQNIIEPAMFSKPVLFGPHTFNFRDVAELFLSKKAALLIRDEASLSKSIKTLLDDPGYAKILGEKAKAAAGSNKGAAESIENGIKKILL